MKIRTTWNLGVGATQEKILAAKVEYYQQFEKVAQAQAQEIGRLREQVYMAESVLCQFLDDDGYFTHRTELGGANETLRRLRTTIRAYEKKAKRRIYPRSIYSAWCDYTKKK